MLGLLMLTTGVGIGTYYQKGTQGGIGPDNLLYAFDTALEWVELNAVTWNESRRIELRLALMQERIDELAELADADKLTEAYRRKLEQEYQKLAEEAVQALTERAKKEADMRTQELFAQMEKTVENQRTSLYTVLQRTPESAGNAMREAFTALEGAFKETVDIVRGE